jgi:hypothetical protein
LEGSGRALIEISLQQAVEAPTFSRQWLTDGGEVVSVSLARRPPFTHRKIAGIHYCYRLSRLQGDNAAGRIRSTEKSNDLIGNRNRALPDCSIVPQATTVLHAPLSQHLTEGAGNIKPAVPRPRFQPSTSRMRV